MYKFLLLQILLIGNLFLSANGQYDNSDENDNNGPDPTTVAATTIRATNPPNNSVNNATSGPTPDPAHVIGQVNNVISNVESLNISGIVDQALQIRPNNGPVRQLVNGIIAAVFCNPFFAGIANCNRQKANVKNVPHIAEFMNSLIPHLNNTNATRFNDTRVRFII